jgi:F1F0 ATPase subunit 2
MHAMPVTTMYAIDPTLITLAVLTGLALGAVFFGGLWWTVRRSAASPRAGLWFSASFLLRTTIVIGGFYLAGAGTWQRLAACLAGFLAARLIVLRVTRPAALRAADAS